MKTTTREFSIARCVIVLALASPWLAAGRETQPLDANWQFHLGDAPGAQAADFNAADWRRVDVPHDWSIELPITKDSPAGGGGGYARNGIGWYRHEVDVPAAWRGQRILLEFDGVYGRTEVWCNGTSLGMHPYGYTLIRSDVTDLLHPGAGNIIAVRVDNSAQPNSRWYSGSGIYRYARLVVTAPVHVAADGVFARTESLAGSTATLAVSVALENATVQSQHVAVEQLVFDSLGGEVGHSSGATDLAASGNGTVSVPLNVSGIVPWSPETPVLYRLRTRVMVDGKTVDEVSTAIGIRTLRVTAAHGLKLNGKTVKLLGGNVHHDNGVLGAAAFDRAEERRVELLKAAGFNAIRTAHNPPSRAFLFSCDRLGMLVLDEAFDGWKAKKTAHDYHEFFDEWSQRDLAAMVTRDRNHPSVVLWSIGNEVFERGSPRGAEIARALAAKVRELDPTRPVAIGLNNVSRNGDFTKLDPVFAAVDVAGYNYDLPRHATDHARLPERVIVGTEAYQSETFANWRIIRDTPYVLGDFVWTALDYLGESGLGRVFPPGEKAVKPWEGDMWPWHGAPCGDIDLIGDRKPESHYRNIVWDRGEKLYAAVLTPPPTAGEWGLTPWSSLPMRASWTWPGQEGRTLSVDVYSRHQSVRLFLNGKLLGEKPTTEAEQFKATFAAPFAAGELKAVGVDNGREVESFVLRSAAAPVRLRAAVDRGRLRADGRDLAFITIDALDGAGVANPNANAPVTVTIDGPGLLAGLGNADLTSMETYQTNPHRLFEGRALAVIRTTRTAGIIKVTVTSPGVEPTTQTLETAN